MPRSLAMSPGSVTSYALPTTLTVQPVRVSSSRCSAWNATMVSGMVAESVLPVSSRMTISLPSTANLTGSTAGSALFV